MAFRVPGQPRPSGGRPITLPRWPRFLLPAAAIIVVVIVLVTVGAGVWTDFLWFRSVGQTGVFDTSYGTKWLLFAIGAIFMIAAVGANMWLAYRLRPEVRPASSDQQGLEAYRQALDPHRRRVAGFLLALIGLISGLSLAGDWRTWLMFANRVSFGVKDPQFRIDVSFFVFDYPFIRMILSFLFAAVLLSIVLAAAVHYLYGGLRPQVRGDRATAGARGQLFVLAGIFVALKAVAYWVDRFGINFSQRGVVQTGASYTDVHAVLPAKTVLAVIALICAALFVAGAIRRNLLLPAIGFGLLVLSAVIIGGVYPAIIQQFVVKPNEAVKERPYISREIASTRSAYGVAGAKVVGFQATSLATNPQLAQAAAALPDTRMLDPRVASTSFQQLQQVKSFYQFPGVLAMDRYLQPGSQVPQDLVIGVRGLTGPPAGQANWINTHLIYTHGFGIIAAQAAGSQSDGSPHFVEGNLPPTGQLGRFQPRIYFGQAGADYVIAGSKQPELDYPSKTNTNGGQQNNSYRGGGGVRIGSYLTRLLFAVRFRELNIMLSSAIDSRARILYIRDPLSRVSKVAPFLTLDGDPYPVISGGQILWVVDGYTTTDNYPYSQRISLQQASSNTYNPLGSAFGPANEVNYIRNSVKATVNAYTGAVHLYQWGKADPVLRAWMKTFPGLVQPQSQIPAPLQPHLRYPEVLFGAQRLILTQFHVQQPQAFYGGQNFWSVVTDPTGQNNQPVYTQPPYYLTLTMPGTAVPEFSLTSSLAQRGRPNLAAYMAVNSNPLSRDYGRIEILQLPQNVTIPGPQQVQNSFENDPPASIELTQLRKGGSKVELGNLITVPLANGLLSVEPVYVAASASGNTGSYPQLKRVFSFFNGQVGYAPTLSASLAQLFGGAVQVPGQPPPAAAGHLSQQVLQLLGQAQHDYQQALAALRSGTTAGLAQYANDIVRENAVLQQVQRLLRGPAKPPGGKSSPSPSPSRSGG